VLNFEEYLKGLRQIQATCPVSLYVSSHYVNFGVLLVGWNFVITILVEFLSVVPHRALSLPCLLFQLGLLPHSISARSKQYFYFPQIDNSNANRVLIACSVRAYLFISLQNCLLTDILTVTFDTSYTAVSRKLACT